MKNPIAVLSSDIHYNLQTLELADKALRMAIDKANSLDVPLIVAGDLHDTKANLRGECVAAMIKTFQRLKVDALVMRGNHDAINEKSKEHSLVFLESLPHVLLITEPWTCKEFTLVPYYYDVKELKEALNAQPYRKTLIMHQGITSADMGHYIQDRSALTPEEVAGRRIISGHYHKRQDIPLPDDGLWSYIGNPYTLGFGEANDPEKGFQVLYNDGSLEFIPTKLPKHIVLDFPDFEGLDIFLNTGAHPQPEDKVFIKVRGSTEDLLNVSKQYIDSKMACKNVRLEIIPDKLKATQVAMLQYASKEQAYDAIIGTLKLSDADKDKLKKLWREFA